MVKKNSTKNNDCSYQNWKPQVNNQYILLTITITSLTTTTIISLLTYIVRIGKMTILSSFYEIVVHTNLLAIFLWFFSFLLMIIFVYTFDYFIQIWKWVMDILNVKIELLSFWDLLKL